jgi:hypothetical protein
MLPKHVKEENPVCEIVQQLKSVPWPKQSKMKQENLKIKGNFKSNEIIIVDLWSSKINRM